MIFQSKDTVILNSILNSIEMTMLTHLIISSGCIFQLTVDRYASVDYYNYDIHVY